MSFFAGYSTGNEVYMRIEKLEPSTKSLLADFVISNSFTAFTNISGTDYDVNGPTMILFTNYRFKKTEGVIYQVKPEMIARFRQEERITVVVGYLLYQLQINLEGIEEDIFAKTFSLDGLTKRNPIIYSFTFWGNRSMSEFSLPSAGHTDVIVKNSGQGSWNEIVVNKKITAVFDAGTHYNTNEANVRTLFAGRDAVYQQDRPALIISHWDVDHYHYLKVMDDATLNSFAFIICRNIAPTLTARKILSKLNNLGANVITLASDVRTTTLKETPLFDVYNNNRFILFNSGVCRNRNKDGISLLIRTASSSVLLPGDQHYGPLDHYVVQPYLNYAHIHYLVVPHHAGNAGRYRYTLHHSTMKEAVISVGKNNYGHPFPKIIQSLRNDNFLIRRTDIHNDVTIHL